MVGLISQKQERAPKILAISGAKATSNGRSLPHVAHCKTT